MDLDFWVDCNTSLKPLVAIVYLLDWIVDMLCLEERMKPKEQDYLFESFFFIVIPVTFFPL